MPFKNIDEYIKTFPESIGQILQKIRELIHTISPDAVEAISYQMPTFRLNGKVLVHFAGYENHIGLYATPTGHKQFAEELSKYKQGKGSVQFSLDQEIPFDLIEKIIKFRVENVANISFKTQPKNLKIELGKPAQRALENASIKTLEDLSKWTKKDILGLQGIGPSSLSKIIKYLKK